MNNAKEQLPHWDLTNVFPSLESDEFKQSIADLTTGLTEIEKHLKTSNICPQSDVNLPAEQLAKALSGYILLIEKTNIIQGTLNSYVNSFITTDSFNLKAKKIMSELEILSLRMSKININAMGWIKNINAIPGMIDQILAVDSPAKEYAFFIKESAQQSAYQMSAGEETLASELSLSGSSAWSKLNRTIVSQLTADFEVAGETKKMPVTMIHNFLSSPDEAIRRKSHETELALFESVQEPLAACLNGVKGASLTVEKRRGRRDPLHRTLDQARMDKETLETMMGAMREYFPVFRKYWKKKAQRLGKEQLAWWDLLAPTGEDNQQYSYAEARKFVVDQFRSFSPKLADFADMAFEKNWIDAEPRPGKSGGAFCMGIAAVEESRILCNFDGSFDSIGCLAHELGHAYHMDCMKDVKGLLRHSPMTMAETASIFNEQIVFNAAIKNAKTPAQELAILENLLIGASQVLVDIFSRFLFEDEVYKRRANSVLSAEEINDIMLQSQLDTYGDGLDPKHLNKYMWTWKSHYYIPSLSYYNFPYAFGHLFALGLYSVYQERGEEFIPQYDKLLSSTGRATPAELAAEFGIDIRSADFWKSSLKIVEGHVNRYLEL